ncbi:SIS domain-containing protein [Nocardia sp. NPDC004722]
MISQLGAQMETEMRQQPEVLAGLAARYSAIGARVAEMFSYGPPAGIAFLARGSSDHAALLGRYAVELHTGLPTCLVAPSIATAYGRDPHGLRGWLLVALSQSGRTPEIVDLVQRYTIAGARVVAVTNDAESPLATGDWWSVALRAGAEEAVPATKTVTAQMLVMLALASGLQPGGMTEQQVAELPKLVENLLDDTAAIELEGRLLANYDRMAVVGRGACFAAAVETALKIQETTGIMAPGFSTADFRHGPIAVTGENAPAVLLAGSGPADADTVNLRATLTDRDAETTLIGTAPDAEVSWPALGHLGEAILATVRGQQLALAISRARGIDPDRPAGLQKVTLTH